MRDTLYTQTVKYGQFAFLQVARYFAKISQKCHIFQKCKKLTGTPDKFPLITRKKYQKRLIISEVILVSKTTLMEYRAILKTMVKSEFDEFI